MNYVFDGHCHLEAAFKLKDRELAVASIKLQDIQSLSDYRNDNTFAKIGYGLHPWFIKALPNYQQMILDVEQYKPNFIGECGLDFLKPNHALQIEVCHLHCKLAIYYDLPIVFHCVRAYNELLQIIKQYPNLRGLVHAFNGNNDMAKQFNKKGFMLGIGSILLNENSQLAKSIIKFDDNMLIFESDSPYMALLDQDISSPDNCIVYANKFAELKKQDLNSVIIKSNDNWSKLFI
ncbi:MAG: TatD family hydrolase [Burkholderiales bacterium]|nr:TatD family hydrolase [Burkholderiales bacterium]